MKPEPLGYILFNVLLWLCIVPAMADDTAVLWQRVQHARECYVKGYADSAMFQARELLPKIMSNGSKIMLAMDYIIIGAVYSERDDKQSALKEYGKVARIAETYDFLKQARNPKLSFLYQTMIPIYAQLTMLCEDLEQYEQSLTYARTGTQWLEQNGDPKQYGMAASVFTEALGNNEYGKEGRANDAGNEEMTALRQEVPVSSGTVRSNANDSATAVGNADSRVGTGARTIVKYVRLPNDRREWAVTVLVIVIVSFLCYVLWQRRMRRKMERETEQQMDERYIEGQEEERVRLARELHDGTPASLIVGMIARQVRQLAQANSWLAQGYSPRELGGPMKISHPLIAEKLGKAARGFAQTTLETAIIELAEADYLMKTGRGNIGLLEHVVLTMCMSAR